ncbi:MAG: DEAD/DEAH box helicase [Hungatella sp.]|jgi:ATP-dependent RNA helicase DeaD|nr:DEAD/DEAH box helicase [Hungatella sp.]
METVRFDELQLDERIFRAVTDMGFEAASPIQAQAIPVQMEGRDVVGQAQTGTGKTAAFGIPLLQKIDPNSKKLQAIALCPTRELAIQVADEVRRLAKYMHGIKVLPIYGGQDIVRQIRGLKDGTQIVIGTPGRVMDHMRRKTIRCEHIHTVIMDEADEMLNMGFLEDMETILSQLPQERQTVMFSATMPMEIQNIAKRFQKDPVTVKVVKKELTVPKVTQYYYEVKPKTKVEVMCRLLDMYAPKLSIAFCNTKRQVDELVQDLQGRGYFAEGLHGDLKQMQRDRVMSSFRSGATEILVATDVAARGIDVDDVEAVFNYDIPQDDEYYVHRIGRTGRAGKDGIAFSLVVGKEVYKLRDIQRYCKTKIIPQAIPSLDDITAIKAEKIMEQVMDLINDTDLTKMVNIIEKKVLEEEECTTLDVAAALLKLAMGEENEDIIDCSRPARSLDDLDRYGRDGRGGRGRGGRDGRYGRDGRGSRDGRYGRDGRYDRDEEEDMARLFVNIGKSQNVRPGDILGAVAGESGISGKMVGSIDMYDNYTFVDVPREYADAVLRAMKDVKIKGKNVHMEKANGRGR